MRIDISKTREEMGKKSAARVIGEIQKAIAARGKARVILATGASQFDLISNLTASSVDWSKVEAFHLDEYIGLPETHPASFRKYLKERFVAKVKGLQTFHWVNGDEKDTAAECKRLGKLISAAPIDVACVGIGENSHLAFNDPPANFDTDEAFIAVTLDEACRKQQMGEGWFKTINDVPPTAITMTIKQIMKAKVLVVTVPDQRKAQAVTVTFEGPVTNQVPASIMQKHPDCDLYLDSAAASLLTGATK